MRRATLVAATIALLVAIAGCGSSGGGGSKNRPPPIERTVLTEVARRAQEDMRAQLHNRTIAVRGMQCRVASRVAYACGLAVVHDRRQRAFVLILLRFDPLTNRGIMAFANASDRTWARILTREGARAGR